MTQIFPSSRTVRTASILVPYRYPLYSPYSSILQQRWARRKRKEHLSLQGFPLRVKSSNVIQWSRLNDHKTVNTVTNEHPLRSSPLHWAQDRNHCSSTSPKHEFFTHLLVTNYAFRGCNSNNKVLVIYVVLITSRIRISQSTWHSSGSVGSGAELGSLSRGIIDA